MTKLPRDLLKVPTNDRLRTYADMEQSCRERMAERVDLTYLLRQEVDGDDWIEAIIARFHEDANLAPLAPGARTLRDDLKIFTLARLPAPQGLGLSRKKIGTYSYGRLRVLAQNAEWALGNADHARQLLDDPNTSEPKIRALIAEATGKVAPAAEKVPVIQFALPEKKIKTVDRGLDEYAKRLEAAGKKVPERDELLVGLIEDWRRLSKAQRDTN